MIIALRVLFGLILLAMLGFTVNASLDRSIVDAGADLGNDPWFRATMADAYFAFLTVWAWIAWRERSILVSLLWLVLVTGLGSLAISVYVLIRLFRVPADARVSEVILPSRPREA